MRIDEGVLTDADLRKLHEPMWKEVLAHSYESVPRFPLPILTLSLPFHAVYPPPLIPHTFAPFTFEVYQLSRRPGPEFDHSRGRGRTSTIHIPTLIDVGTSEYKDMQKIIGQARKYAPKDAKIILVGD